LQKLTRADYAVSRIKSPLMRIKLSQHWLYR